MVLFIIMVSRSTFFTIEMNSTEVVQYVESDSDSFNMQPPDVLVAFLLPEKMHRCVLFDEFHEVWTFDLLPIAIGVYAISSSLYVFCFAVLATNVQNLMTCFNVAY